MQRLPIFPCHHSKPFLMRLLSACICIALFGLFTGCSRNNDSVNESTFYGTWIKGTAAGDTLQFMRKNNQNILRRNVSFNASHPAYQEVLYSYKNGKLWTELVPGSGLREIESFAWKTMGKEFDLQGYQMYLIMSSTLTRFNFIKID